MEVVLRVFKVVDGLFLIAFFGALTWVWMHRSRVKRKILEMGALPRDATRGLVYGLIFFLIAGILIVHIYWWL